MYGSIGKKLKSLAKVQAIAGIIASSMIGISLMLLGEGLMLAGFIIIIFGSLMSWLSSWALYGFGEMIDKICDIERNTRKDKLKSDNQTKPDNEKISLLEKLHLQNLITDEEYQQALMNAASTEVKYE